MAEAAKAQEEAQPEVVGDRKSVEAFVKTVVDPMIKDRLNEYLPEDKRDELLENIGKSVRKWESATESEKQTAFRNALEGRSPRRGPVGKKSTLWFLKDHAHDTDYEAGAGHKFADVLPFVAKASQNGNHSFKWSDVVRLANDGIKHGDRTFKNKAIGDRLEKALSADTVDDGGGLIPEELAADFIGYLYDQSVVRQAGARTIEMPGGHLDLGRQNQTATAYWVGGDTSQITSSQQKFERLRLEAKKLGVLVPMSNDVVRRVPRGMEQLVRDDVVNVANLEEDIACIRGTGTNGKPKGIKESVAAGNSFNSGGDTTGDIITDLAKAMYKVVGAQIPMASPGWILHPRTFFYFMQLQDADNNLVSFMASLADGQLMGYPVYRSAQLPTNLADGGGGSDATEIYFGDFGQCVIGETLNLKVDTTNSGTVGSDNLFEQDMQALRLVHEMDFVLRHNEAFSVIEQFDACSSLD